jgi:cytochrome c peroxidase
MRRTAVLSIALMSALSFRQVPSTFEWNLPPGFPVPVVPLDNPMSGEKAELGRYLFYDTRLSGNGTQSCATCHEQRRAFTDGRAVSVGSTGALHRRSSLSLANVGYVATLTWANPSHTSLEGQARIPMFGRNPIELGLPLDGRWLEPLRRDPRYQALLRSAYPEETGPLTERHVVQALASFQRTLISGRSPYDRYLFERQDEAISEAAKRGAVLFHSGPFLCFSCHGGFNLSGPTASQGLVAMPQEFHNTGLYNLSGALSYPAIDTGLHGFTGKLANVGQFKAPTLRNIAVTAPYMHDGSVATLQEAVAHYAAAGRTIESGPYLGHGRDNPNKSQRIQGFASTDAETADLIAFLESLTDETFLRDERFADPFKR